MCDQKKVGDYVAGEKRRGGEEDRCPFRVPADGPGLPPPLLRVELSWFGDSGVAGVRVAAAAVCPLLVRVSGSELDLKMTTTPSRHTPPPPTPVLGGQLPPPLALASLPGRFGMAGLGAPTTSGPGPIIGSANGPTPSNERPPTQSRASEVRRPSRTKTHIVRIRPYAPLLRLSLAAFPRFSFDRLRPIDTLHGAVDLATAS
ncbi:hypothetical protein HPB47_011460 [Ixodes persulcatus]|uniref:Uncharacterized protein n=1 Tax=Ixodes persulcatus TaxID=34615 RepID=A0AC60NWG1_IXOPE|nr:hypothetical protein HPB47_011460 [Ixodes persulcatus]